MSHPTSSQAQPPRKKNRHDGRLSGSLLSLTLVRLRGDGEATFHSPQDAIYNQVGKGKNAFVDLDEAISLYPTLAEIPAYLLPSPEVLENVKNNKGEVVRCPFCPSTFSGIVVKRSFKRHLQRHWNHAAVGKVAEIDDQHPSTAPSLVSPIAHPVLDAMEPSNEQGHATSDPGAQQSSHALPTSTPTPLIALASRAPSLGPLIPPKRRLTTPVHAASNTPKAPTSKRGRKSVPASVLGNACKDSATLAVARALEVLHSKAGMVFHAPDAYPDLEHQSFTQRDEQFLDVDATFSAYPTIDQLPQRFWPTALQYTSAAAGEHRVRCLFCSWSFTGVYVKANFRGHVRYHWKLAAASQQATSSPATNDQRSPAISPSPGPSASPLVAQAFRTSSHVLQPDDAGSSKVSVVQPSPPSEVRGTQVGQMATSGGVVTNLKAWRPQERKRTHAEAFSEEDTSKRESSPVKYFAECAKLPHHPVSLSIARALSSIRRKPGTILIPPEQPMSYEELVLVVDRYFDIDKAVSLYPLVGLLPDRFWPSDETFKQVRAKGEPEKVRCPFCTSTFKGNPAKRNMQIHLQRHWWHASGQSSLKTPDEIRTTNIESFDAALSPNLTPIPPPPYIHSMVRANANLESAGSTITRTHMDLEVNRGNHGTRPQAMDSQLQSTLSGPIAQRVQQSVCFKAL